jgi:hypothetical protein
MKAQQTIRKEACNNGVGAYSSVNRPVMWVLVFAGLRNKLTRYG